MNDRLLADTAKRAGGIMLRAGAETFRVEDTVRRILAAAGVKKSEVLVISTAILITIESEDSLPISITERITERGSNLGNICEVNHMSRSFCSGRLSLQELSEQLQHLENQKGRYSHVLELCCTIITVTMFALLLGASFAEAGLATMAALVLIPVELLAKRLKIHEFIYYMMALTCAVFLVTVLQNAIGADLNPELMVAGIAMPFLPGLAVTNAIRDTLQGDYISGAARLLEAFVKAAACAVGIGLGLFLGNLVMGGVLG